MAILAKNNAMTDSTQQTAKRIGSLIAQRRKARGLTQAQVAESMGISNDALSRMERGGIMPSIPRLIQLSQILNCQTADFLTHSSPTLSDQGKRLETLLSKLDESEREEFLQMVENLLQWHLSRPN